MVVRFILSAALLGAAFSSKASARAVCGHRGQALVDEVDAASAVFVGRIEEPAVGVHQIPSGHRGTPGADVIVVVTQVFKGAVRIGDRVRIRWEGWSEAQSGPTVGGCRVPATEPGERYPIEMLVIAHGDTSLVVRNDSTSQRLGAANQSVLRRVRRLAR